MPDNNKIMQAITQAKLINLRYDAMGSLGRAYEIEYYVRKKTRRIEYYLGYDTSGGNSGKMESRDSLLQR